MVKFVLLLAFATVLIERSLAHPVSLESSKVKPELPAAVDPAAVDGTKKDTEASAVVSVVKKEVHESSDKKDAVVAEIEKKDETAVEVEKKEEIAVETEKKGETAVVPAKKEETAVETEIKGETAVVPEKKEETAVVPAKKEDAEVVPVKEKDNTPVVAEKKEETKTEAIKETKEDTVVEPAVETKADIETKNVAAAEETVVALGKPEKSDEKPETPVDDVAVNKDDSFVVPDVPKIVESSEYGTSRLAYIWSNRLFQYHKVGGILKDASKRPQPTTILVASEIKMINLVPQDAPHPLYSDEFTTLTDNFILDSLSTTYVDPEDKKMLTPEGLTIKTETGKDLVFKKDPKTNAMTVNGVAITKSNKLVDGENKIIVFDIEDVLFDYRKEIDAAFEILSKKSPAILGPLVPAPPAQSSEKHKVSPVAEPIKPSPTLVVSPAVEEKPDINVERKE